MYSYCTPNNLISIIKGNNNDISVLLDITKFINCDDEIKQYIKDAIITYCNEGKDNCNERNNHYNNLMSFWYGSNIISPSSNIESVIEVIQPNDKLKNNTPISTSTCFFKMFVPKYVVNTDKLYILIKKRLEESINGYLLLKESGDGFNIV
jgi:hypothetical protein